jgi:hypothetical protein
MVAYEAQIQAAVESSSQDISLLWHSSDKAGNGLAMDI